MSILNFLFILSSHPISRYSGPQLLTTHELILLFLIIIRQLYLYAWIHTFHLYHVSANSFGGLVVLSSGWFQLQLMDIDLQKLRFVLFITVSAHIQQPLQLPPIPVLVVLMRVLIGVPLERIYWLLRPNVVQVIETEVIALRYQEGTG